MRLDLAKDWIAAPQPVVVAAVVEREVDAAVGYPFQHGCTAESMRCTLWLASLGCLHGRWPFATDCTAAADSRTRSTIETC